MINLASDLDGTIYLGSKLIDGVKEAYNTLIQNNVNIIFVTNNSSQSPDELKLKLENLLKSNINLDKIITPLKLFNYYVHYSKYNL